MPYLFSFLVHGMHPTGLSRQLDSSFMNKLVPIVIGPVLLTAEICKNASGQSSGAKCIAEEDIKPHAAVSNGDNPSISWLMDGHGRVGAARFKLCAIPRAVILIGTAYVFTV